MNLLRELLPCYKTPGEHIENNGIIYDIQPLPEMNISIITASTKMLQKGWHRQVFIWLPLGLVIGLLAAMFVLRILRRIQSPHHRLQDAIENRDICVHYQPIVSLANGKLSVLRALARWPEQTVVSCHQMVLFRWHGKRAFLSH